MVNIPRIELVSGEQSSNKLVVSQNAYVDHCLYRRMLGKIKPVQVEYVSHWLKQKV